jgi:hypothetical protein
MSYSTQALPLDFETALEELQQSSQCTQQAEATVDGCKHHREK